MSEGEGNSKEKRFRRFHERVSEAAGYTGKQRLLFAPDFFDSLARVMAAPGNLDERTLAWSKYFAWGNYNEFAIRIEGDGRDLRLTQTDCGWDLAWLETGIRVEWLDAPPHIRDAELSRLGIKSIDKSLVSKAFTSNETRGTIVPSPPTDRRYSTARTIEPAVSPAAPRPVKVDDSQEFHEFQEWFKVEHSKDFREREVARSVIKHINKVELSLYKEWRTAKRNRPPSYKRLETENTTTTEVEVTSTGETKAVVVMVPPSTQAPEAAAETKAVAAAPPPATFGVLRSLYPPKVMDEPNARPAFEALSPEEKQKAIDGLAVYLTCEVWVDRPDLIPFCSNFLRKRYYACPPTPLRRKRDGKLEEEARSMREGAELLRSFRRARGAT
jgi:hypothetical protein